MCSLLNIDILWKFLVPDPSLNAMDVLRITVHSIFSEFDDSLDQLRVFWRPDKVYLGLECIEKIKNREKKEIKNNIHIQLLEISADLTRVVYMLHCVDFFICNIGLMQVDRMWRIAFIQF